MSNKFSRRNFLKMAGVAASSVAVQGFVPKILAQSDSPVELRFWTHNNIGVQAYIEKKIEEYKSIRPNVSIEYATAEVNDHETRLFTGLAAGAGPDGFNMGDWNFPRLATQGWLAPVAAEVFEQDDQAGVIDQFIPSSLVGMVQDGNLLGIPFEWNALDLYVNRGAFIEAGLDPDNPPSTWEDVTEAAKLLVKTDDVGNINFLGFQQSYGPGSEWTLKRLHPMLVQAGLDVLDADMARCSINSPEAVEIIEYYLSWTNELGVAMQGFEPPAGGSAFRTGYSGMNLSGSYEVGSIGRASPDWEYGADDGWDVAPFPQWAGDRLVTPASAMWRWGLFVNNESPNAEEMWAFIHFMIQDVNEVRSEVGYIPSLKGWLDNPDNYEAEPYLEVQKADLDIGIPVPQTPKYGEVAQQILEMTERVYSGAQSVSDSVAEACGRIDTILAE